jgi:uncharacterized protein (TIGR02996 family)
VTHLLMRDAVVKDPGDELTRLAYADACEEAGMLLRAQFVRDMLALEKRHDETTHGSWVFPSCSMAEERNGCRDCGQSPYDLKKCDFHRDKHICEKLLDHDEVLHDIPRPLRDSFRALRFRGGFVDKLTVPIAVWMKFGRKMLQRNPITYVRTDRIHSVHFVHKTPHFIPGDPYRSPTRLPKLLCNRFDESISAMNVSFRNLTRDDLHRIAHDTLSVVLIDWAKGRK